MTGLANEALQNLTRPEYSGIRHVFRKVLIARSKQPQSDCTLLTWLTTKARSLELLNEDCLTYLHSIGLEDAARKCRADLLGQATRSAEEFNGACGDFWAEMAAIRTLAAQGYDGFCAIHVAQPDGTTSDYEAFLAGAPAHIEVKNMRVTRTVLDVFDHEIGRCYTSNPAEYAFNIQVRYAYDNAPTAQQERIIRQYVSSLGGRKPPFKETLDLDEAVAQISVVAGSGTVSMIRGIGPTSPEPLSKEKFLAKVHDKADQALAQMKDRQRLRVLVLNFNSPGACVSEDFINDAKNVIKEVLGDEVQPFVLHHRYLAE